MTNYKRNYKGLIRDLVGEIYRPYQDPKYYTLLILGDVGKTSLALALSREIADEGEGAALIEVIPTGNEDGHVDTSPLTSYTALRYDYMMDAKLFLCSALTAMQHHNFLILSIPDKWLKHEDFKFLKSSCFNHGCHLIYLLNGVRTKVHLDPPSCIMYMDAAVHITKRAVGGGLQQLSGSIVKSRTQPSGRFVVFV